MINFLVRFKSIQVRESNRSQNKGIETNLTDRSKVTGNTRLRNNQSNETAVSQSAFLLQLEFCWEHLFPYLSNNDICKLDSALTQKILRETYLKRLRKFYKISSIYSIQELEWIMKRGARLTVCRLEFDYYHSIDYGKHVAYLSTDHSLYSTFSLWFGHRL